VFGPAGGAAPPARSPAAVVVTGITAVTPRGVFEGTAVADAVETPLADGALDVVLPEAALDEERARRLDRTSRMAAVACERALGKGSKDAGVVLGIAFGAIDATAEYMRRLRDKGPRLVRPADFPGLVPSSPAGYASIYLGLRGPAFVVGDLAVSGECAVAQAAELIAAGMAERVCAAAIEERSKLVEEVLSVVFNAQSGSGVGETAGARREGGAAIALASESAGLPALARLGAIVALQGDDAAPLAELPSPPARAIVVLPSGERELPLVQVSSWRAAPRLVCAPGCGAHEAAGAIAIAVAAAKVARGDVDGALFVGSARGYGYAGTVWPAAERR
jgi:3-oxoacyl-[acyl-carrier-protein] synthase II